MSGDEPADLVAAMKNGVRFADRNGRPIGMWEWYARRSDAALSEVGGIIAAAIAEIGE